MIDFRLRVEELGRCHPFKLIRIDGAIKGDPGSGKKPMDVGWQHESMQGSSEDAISVLKSYPETNFAIPAGPCQTFNLVVIDEDIANGKCGDQSRADLELELGSLPKTWEVITGSGGRHYYYKLPSDVVIGNRIGFRLGLDIKSSGGYVVAPGSMHYSGGMYRWVDGRSPDDLDISVLPDAWIRAIAKPKKEQIHGAHLVGNTKFRSMVFYNDLVESIYFPGTRVTKDIDKFFSDVASSWREGNPNNPPWIHSLFCAASDAERLAISIQNFTQAVATVAPFGHLTDVDIYQIHRGYLRGSNQAAIFENKKNQNNFIYEKGVSHE